MSSPLSHEIVLKPCADCSVLVEDIDDPNFKDDWLCTWCHCTREGKDHKKYLNASATIIKRACRLFGAYPKSS